VFSDLDATLRALLSDPAAPADLRAADVSFDTPDRQYQPAQATLNLFLHQVAENRDLREDGRVVARTGSGYTRRQPPLRVDATYLATTWSSRTAGLRAEEEHRLLGLALLWLSGFPVIGELHLQGSLLQQPYPVSAVVARTREDRAAGEFWSALGIPPRPGFPLTVTIAVEPFDVGEEFPAVRAVQLRTTSLDDPVLTGRVLDAELAPVPDATVTLVGRDGAAVGTRTSDGEGAFAFPDADFGVYTLRVQAAGHPDQERQLAYARDSQVHDVVLPRP
jgi:hypothetical protein